MIYTTPAAHLPRARQTKATEKPVPEKSTPEKSKSVKTEITPTDDADRSPKVIVDIEGYLRRLDKMAARLEDDGHIAVLRGASGMYVPCGQ